MVKHLYQRTITHNGKKIKAWYYWYYDENHKQIRKSCGQNGKPCLIKRDAQAYIESIKDSDLLPQCSITFNDFCSGMFDDGSKYLTKLHNKGTDFVEKTLKQKRIYLSIFLDKFGNYRITDVDFGFIDNWLLEFKRSNSWRNNFLSVINAIYNELYIYRVIDRIPLIERYKRIDTKEKGILYPDEIKLLFPSDFERICDIWRIGIDNDEQIYSFATMIFTILSTGMRSGEIRALKESQFIRPDVILINSMMDASENRVDHLKKGNEKNKKWRIAILPEKAVKMIETMKSFNLPHNTDYFFEYHGEQVGAEFLNRHFKLVLNKNGIDHEGRNITIHSLRFTYNTMMRKEISEDDLRKMIGHTSKSMTDYYDKSQATDYLPLLLENKAVIDSAFN